MSQKQPQGGAYQGSIALTKSSVFTKKVGTLSVEPRGQQRLLLGRFTKSHPAKGFSITFSPEIDLPDTIATDITTINEDGAYELVLHVANYGDKLISAEVWGM